MVVSEKKPIEELLGYLDELAKEVDAFEELHIKFASANV